MVVLKNGMTLGIGLLENVSGDYCHNGGIAFYVDIDGKRGNSILGKDIFAFNLQPQKSEQCSSIPRDKATSLLPGLYSACHCNDFYSSSLTSFLGTRSGGCNISASGSVGNPQGAYCSSAIAKNGWKIPDNYPVKKF